jgi:hypothetical protein
MFQPHVIWGILTKKKKKINEIKRCRIMGYRYYKFLNFKIIIEKLFICFLVSVREVFSYFYIVQIITWIINIVSFHFVIC